MAFSTLEKLLLGYVGLDYMAPGMSRKVLVAGLSKIPSPLPASTRAVAGTPITGLQAARIATPPAALATGLYYTALAAQDQARRDAEEYEQPRIPIPLWNPILGDMPTIPINPISGGPLVKKTRKASSFNKAVSAGMKAVRSSKFLGKPGIINNSKTAFKTVTKTVSAMKKGRKRPSKGVRGTIARAVRRYI